MHNGISCVSHLRKWCADVRDIQSPDLRPRNVTLVHDIINFHSDLSCRFIHPLQHAWKNCTVQMSKLGKRQIKITFAYLSVCKYLQASIFYHEYCKSVWVIQKTFPPFAFLQSEWLRNTFY